MQHSCTQEINHWCSVIKSGSQWGRGQGSLQVMSSSSTKLWNLFLSRYVEIGGSLLQTFATNDCMLNIKTFLKFPCCRKWDINYRYAFRLALGTSVRLWGHNYPVQAQQWFLKSLAEHSRKQCGWCLFKPVRADQRGGLQLVGWIEMLQQWPVRIWKSALYGTFKRNLTIQRNICTKCKENWVENLVPVSFRLAPAETTLNWWDQGHKFVVSLLKTKWNMHASKRLSPRHKVTNLTTSIDLHGICHSGTPEQNK